MTPHVSPRMIERQEIRDLFHDAWQGLTALKIYVGLLERSPTVIGQDQVVVQELGAIIHRVEQELEGIRARVLSSLG